MTSSSFPCYAQSSWNGNTEGLSVSPCPSYLDTLTILVTGCFDLLTPAHMRLLEWCNRLGEVHVRIDSAASIKALAKGAGRPLLSEDERLDALELCPWVAGRTGVFDGPGAASAIRSVKPDIWVKGGDYLRKDLRGDELDAVEEVGAGVLITKRFAGPSTTEIVERIRGRETG